METIFRTVLLLLICWLGRVRCLSVLFADHQPVFVIKGETLILQAQIVLLKAERLAKVTWEREAKASGTSLTLAEFPLKVSDGRVRLENQGVTLKIQGFQPADGGVYTVTVTDTSGQKRSAQKTVQEYLAVNHVSVMLNVSHRVLHCMEAWGTEPSFTWLHERVRVTDAVGRVSADGASLQVSSSSFCGHFTCVVSNRLGHSSATYTAEPCESSSRSTTTAVVFLLLLLTLIGASLGFLLWRKRRYNLRRRQRLREPIEDRL